MISKLRITYGMLVIAAMLVSSCITERLNEDTSYDESFSSMYVSSDQKKIVVMGRDYHYVFNAPPELLRLVNSDLHSDLRAVFSVFDVDVNNITTGQVKLYLQVQYVNNRLTVNQLEKIEKAKGMGMALDEHHVPSIIVSFGGMRYAAPPSPITADDTATKLNNPHAVRIHEQPSTAYKGARTLLSPITKTADGVLKLAALPLAPIAIVVILGSCNACR